eukprot:1157303-Pelagomonas_calceolata.AAC.3
MRQHEAELGISNTPRDGTELAVAPIDGEAFGQGTHKPREKKKREREREREREKEREKRERERERERERDMWAFNHSTLHSKEPGPALHLEHRMWFYKEVGYSEKEIVQIKQPAAFPALSPLLSDGWLDII